jgi:hypothetical protein
MKNFLFHAEICTVPFILNFDLYMVPHSTPFSKKQQWMFNSLINDYKHKML